MLNITGSFTPSDQTNVSVLHILDFGDSYTMNEAHLKIRQNEASKN